MYDSFDPSFLAGGSVLSNQIFSCFTTGHARGTGRALCLGKGSVSHQKQSVYKGCVLCRVLKLMCERQKEGLVFLFPLRNN